MTKSVGLWIDHKRAVIVSGDGQGAILKQIESGAKHVEYRGAPRPKTSYSAQYSQGDDQLDNQFVQQLNRYYAQVISALGGANHVLILGPGEAKSELKKRLDREKGPGREIHVEAADKMTDRQIAARVRKYFEDMGE